MNTIALYCGSFNPFHIGHLDVFHKAEHIFGEDNVVICQGVNPDKAQSDHSIMNIKSLTGKRRIVYANFTHELYREVELENPDYSVVLIKGIRNGFDLVVENDQLQWMNDFRLEDHVDAFPMNIMYIPSDVTLQHISSSAIRSVNKLRASRANKFIVK